jgi:hypothetical protein
VTSAPPQSPGTARNGLRLREIVLGLALTGLSGMAVLAQAWFNVPMSFTVTFAVLPGSIVLVGLVLVWRRRYDRLHLFSRLVLVGGAWGLAATLFYDAVRPLLRVIFQFQADPYRAMPIFGQLITGLPSGDGFGLFIGWVYHFWNGITFGMIFAFLFPRGGWWQGVLFAEALQLFMMLAYPSLLQARLDDPGWLTMGIVGHGIYGAVLGSGVRWSHNRWIHSHAEPRSLP